MFRAGDKFIVTDPLIRSCPDIGLKGVVFTVKRMQGDSVITTEVGLENPIEPLRKHFAREWHIHKGYCILFVPEFDSTLDKEIYELSTMGFKE